MKFALAIAAFGLFAFFISWGVIMMMHGSPLLLIAAMGVFLGSFIKFGCLSHYPAGLGPHPGLDGAPEVADYFPNMGNCCCMLRRICPHVIVVALFVPAAIPEA